MSQGVIEGKQSIKCNRSVYVTENKMVEFIRHIDDNMCKQHELQEA